VRDVLMGEPNFDVDIAVEGDGIALGEELADALHGRVVPHDRFGTAVVLHDGGRVDVVDRAGRAVLVDGERGGPSWDEGTAKSWTKRMPDGERYYGFGSRTGLLEKRGRRYTCWTTDEWRHQGPTTDELYVAAPFFLGLDASGRSYGVFLDTTFRSAFDLSALAERELRFEVDDGPLDYYLFHGPEPARVVELFTELVGRMPLPPRWALGFHQSRWGYESAEEVLAVAREFRAREIPLDVIHLDLDHMEACRSFSWNTETFPDPAGLVSDLDELGVKTVCIVSAGIERGADDGYRIYDEGHERGVFLRRSREPGAEELTGYVWPGLCVFPDHVRPEVRAWWGALYEPHLALGVAGFLNDMNEPAMHDLPYEDPDSRNTEPPLDLPHGPDDEPATHAEVRNVYAYLEDLGTYEALRRAQPGTRPFLLTRAGYAGVQRFAGCWTGDSSSLWEHLESSLPQLANLGLSGMPFAGADIGGFFGDCGPELLARWTQLGALTPLARNHSARGTAPQEPWVWDESVEETCRRALELRYRLLPYLYTLFEEASRTGAPVLRPLFFHHASDPATHQLSDEALLGGDLLLAPVVRPGVEARAVYLPAGRWFDLRTGECIAGAAWVTVSATLDEQPPLFARGGSILPFGPVRQWTDAGPLDPLELHVFPDAEGSADGRLYEDDGVSFAYEHDERCTTRFTCRRDASELIVESRREGAYEPPARAVRVLLHLPGTVREHVLAEDAAEWEVAVA